MADLVERLRGLAEVEAHTSACRATCTCGHIPNLYRAAREAAAEIERLRTVLGQYAHDLCEMGASHDCCGLLSPVECGGCAARQALKGPTDGA